METFLYIFGGLMILGTAVPIVKADVWWIRVFDFPRLQIMIAAVLALAAFLYAAPPYGAADVALAALLFLSIAYQSYMMFPYTRLAAKQVQPARRIRPEESFSLLFANVLESNRNSGELKGLISQYEPDIVLTAEVNGWWDAELKELEKNYPFSVLQPQDNTYGMILYSKLEIIDAEVKFLVKDDIPSIHGRVRLLSGRDVQIRCLHPRPPFPTEDDSSTGRDAELLLVGKEIKGIDDPVVVFGDLNDVAWSRTNYLFQDISGLLDPRIGRGFFHTFHARYPFVRFPLDHFFHSNHFRLIDFRRLPYFGSDHFPVYIELSYEPDAEHTQEQLEADADQKKEAQEKIAKAR